MKSVVLLSDFREREHEVLQGKNEKIRLRTASIVAKKTRNSCERKSGSAASLAQLVVYV